MARLAVRIDPPVAVVGKPFDVAVEITAKTETRVEYVAVRLIGLQGFTWSGVFRKETVPELVTYLLRGGGILRKGVNRLIATFNIGEGPPSHELDPAWARYELQARVHAPWWFGTVSSAPLVVRAAPLSTLRYPMVARTSPEPVRMEISLASSRVVAGEIVHGRCAVFGLPDERAREIELSLEPTLVLRSSLIGNVLVRHNRSVLQTILPAGTGGTSVPFAFTVPEQTTATFKSLSHELWRDLVITTGHLKLKIPLEVVDPTADMPPMPVAPPLGGEHVAAAFDEFATQHGWRRDDRGTSHAITRTVDDIELRIDCDYRGKDGTWLVARATYPSLGLGLDVTPASLLRNVLGDVSIGDPEWDRAYDVQARSPEQAKPFVTAVAPSTTAAVLGMLSRWSDESITYEHPVETVDQPLTAVAEALGAVSRAIESHRGLIDLSPDVDIDRERIRELARELRGRLALGNLVIDGWLGGLPVAIRTHWERARAMRIAVVVGSADTATEFARMVEIAISRPASGDEIADAEAKRLVGLASWHAHMVELRVTNGVASAELLLDADSERVVIDVERLRQLVEALHAIRVALEPASGPYR